MRRKALAWILILCMIFSSMPMSVFATTSTDANGEQEIMQIEESATNVVKVGNTEYGTIDEALNAAKAMTGDVTVEIYDKVTLNTSLAGSYTSIRFVGKDTDAEIYLDVQGYITATGKKVAFENLILSKSVGGYITNAGFMNVAFGVYDVNEVTYEGCKFTNGAYASSGKVTFTDCTFYRSHDKYGLWAYGDVKTIVDDCEFADYRGIKMYAEGAAKTIDLTVKNTDFSKVTDKPAIVLTHGESVTLEGNTYSSTGTFELDLDGAPNGTAVTSDVAPTCKNDNGACGVLVDGKIYTTVAQAAEVATAGSTVTLLHDSEEIVEFAEGVTVDKNGYNADKVTSKVAVDSYEKLKETIEAGETDIKVIDDISITEAITIPEGVTVSIAENKTVRVLDTVTNNGTIAGAGKIMVGTMVYTVETQNPYDDVTYDVKATKSGAISGTAPTCVMAYDISLDEGENWFEDTNSGKTQAVLVKTDGTRVLYASFQNAYTSAKTGEVVHMLKDAHVQSTNSKKNNGPLRSYYGLILEGNGHTIYTDLESSGASNEYATIKFTSYLDGTGPEVNPVLKNVTVDSQKNAKADLDYVSGDVTFTVTMFNVNLLGNCQYASFAMKSPSMIINKSNVEIYDCTIPSWDTGSANEINFYSGDYALSLNNKCTVYGGTFTKDVTNYLADGKKMEKIDGKYVAVEDPAYGKEAQIGDVYYASVEDAFTAAQNGDEVKILQADTYTLSTSGKNITITGTVDGVVFEMGETQKNMGYASVVFNNVEFNWAATGWPYHGLQHCGDMEYNNCTINGTVWLYGPSETFNQCKFNVTGDTYNVWTYGAKDVEFNECKFNSAGKSVLIYSESADMFNDVTVTDCVFSASASVEGKAAIEMDSSLTSGINLTITGETTVVGFGTGNVSGNSLWNNKKGNDTVANNDITVKVNEEIVLAPVKFVAQIGDAVYKDLHAAMVAAKAGETVLLINDVDLAGTEWEPVSFKGTFDGQNHVISNLKINKPGVSNTGFITSLNGTFKNVTFTNPTVTGGENTGVVAGTSGGGAALAENITVNGTIKVETTHSGYARAGAIVGGWGYGNYKNITVDGGDKAVSYIKHTGGGDGRYVAGIVGHADDVASYVNCTVKNITIDGNRLCGGIAGPGPSSGLATGCVVENVDIAARESGGMFGWYHGSGTIDNSKIKDVTFTEESTKNGAIGGYANNTSANIQNVTIENVANKDGSPLLNHFAKIGDTYYDSLADAIAAVKNGETITLVKDNNENITIKQVPGVTFTIDGSQKTITGTITVDGQSQAYATAGVIIKNMNFDAKNIATDACIRLGDGTNATRYTSNVTVDNCTFTGDYKTTGAEKVAIKSYTGGDKNLTVTGCIVDNMHSLLQVKNVAGLEVANCEVTDSKNGISVGNSTDVTIMGTRISAEGYGVRADGNDAGNTANMSVEDCTISAVQPVVVRKVTQTYDLTVTGGYLTPVGSEYAVVITNDDDSTYVQPTGNYELSVNNVAGKVFPDSDYVAKIGEKGYFSLEDAIVAAPEGETITLLVPVVVNAGETLTLRKAVTIEYTSNVPSEDMFTNKGTMIVDGATLVYVNTDTTANNVTVSTISSEPGSVLEVKSGVVKNDSANNATNGIYAYAIDLLTNGSLGDVTATISGGEVISTYYMAIRQFNNGEACKNTLTITDGKVYGAKRAVQVHFKNNGAYTTISGGTIEGGDYALCFLTTSENLSVTGGDFNGSVWYSGTDGFISGGTFDAPVEEEYCAEGYIPKDNGDGTYGVKQGKFVVQIGDTKYEKLHAAIEAAQAGDIITLLADCDENVTIKQVPGVTFTIDGNQKTMTGTITVDGQSQAYATAGVTIKNLKFDATNISKDASINLGGNNNIRYTSNVTVENCTFAGTGKVKVAIKNYTGGCKNLTVTNCTASGLHSLAQLKGVEGLNVSNCTVTDSKNGIAVGTSKNVTIEDVTATVDGYGIRADGEGAYDMTVINCIIAAEKPIIVRKATGAYNLTVEGGGYTPSNEGKYAVILTNGDDEAALAVPTGKYSVDVSEGVKVYPNSDYVAQIGERSYFTLAEALTAAVTDDTIILLQDTTERSVVVPASVSLDLNGHTLTADYVASFGDVIDSTDGAGALKVANNRVYLMAGNTQLPLYDANPSAVEGAYKFFDYSMEQLVRSEEANTVTFAYRLIFTNVEAYELIATGEAGTEFGTTISWDGSIMTIPYTYSNDFVKKYGSSSVEYFGSTSRAVFTLKVKGLDKISDKADYIYATPYVKTVSGMEVVANDANAFPLQ